jgi:hypothetical protein
MIAMRRAQLSFGDWLIAEEVSDLREVWMTHADTVLADDAIVGAVYDRLDAGKLLRVFEPATEIIRKGKAGKPNEFGKMLKLQEPENQIVIDFAVYDRRPNDADLLVGAIEAHQTKLGRTPRLVAADAGFSSARNEAAAKAMGVKRVCNPNRRPKAASANVNRRSAGSAAARNGTPDAKDASASSSAATVSNAAVTTASEECTAGPASA